MIQYRQSSRLKSHDYTKPGYYFITINTQNYINLFGKIENNKMHLNEPGKMIETQWEKLETRFKTIKLHTSIIMPNHLHAIIQILPAVRVPLVGDPSNKQPHFPIPLSPIAYQPTV